MIGNHNYSQEEISSLEQKYLKDYFNSTNPIFSDSLEYYAILFQTFLQKHGDHDFKQLEAKKQAEIYKLEDSRFRSAMSYSFEKGHQVGFSLLLSDTLSTNNFDEKAFSKANSNILFLYTLDEMISEKVYESNLNRHNNEFLMNFTRRHFENYYKEIMDLAKTFYKKGIMVAYDQIQKKLVKTNYDIKGFSRLLHVPYNQDFEVTPAFSATFSLETPAYEEWDLHWDATYGYDLGKKLIGKVLIHQLLVKDIKTYAEIGASTYEMLNQYFGSVFDDNEVVYLAEVNFSVNSMLQQVRVIENSEYSAIKKALALSITRQLQVNENKVLVTI